MLETPAQGSEPQQQHACACMRGLLPDGVHFLYDGKPLKLSLAAEEVATFYGKMLHLECTSKEVFRRNFFSDWRKEMTPEERRLITHLDKCDFTEIHKHFLERAEARRTLPREQKQKLKEEAEKLQQEFGYCVLDGHREKIGNFKTEPPGLFRGRGDHPKMGMLKRRVMPEDVVINCSRDSKIPEPPAGHQWKEVRSDNTVMWLAAWVEHIQNSFKYVILNPSSKPKTSSLNKHLQDLMEGLTAKVFRTYNASVTLQEQLRVLTRAEDSVTCKVLAYNRANRAVAVLCNHQRAVPKTFEKSMQTLQKKIETKKAQVAEAQVELQKAETDLRMRGDSKPKSFLQKQRRLLKLEEQLARLCAKATDKEENKQVALGTAKLNYLDPRISIAWCKRFGVPVEKIYNKTQRERFAWAFNQAGEDFEF